MRFQVPKGFSEGLYRGTPKRSVLSLAVYSLRTDVFTALEVAEAQVLHMKLFLLHQCWRPPLQPYTESCSQLPFSAETSPVFNCMCSAVVLCWGWKEFVWVLAIFAWAVFSPNRHGFVLQTRTSSLVALVNTTGALCPRKAELMHPLHSV